MIPADRNWIRDCAGRDYSWRNETQMNYDLSGIWTADIGDGQRYELKLPGTLDESGIGHDDVGANQWHPDAELGAGRGKRNVSIDGESDIR